MDIATLLSQIFGQQPGQEMQISGQTGWGQKGPSKFQQFGSLLETLGQAGTAGATATAGGTATPTPTAGTGTNQNAMDLLKSLFPNLMTKPKPQPMYSRPGGNSDRSGGDGTGGRSGRDSMY